MLKFYATMSRCQHIQFSFLKSYRFAGVMLGFHLNSNRRNCISLYDFINFINSNRNFNARQYSDFEYILLNKSSKQFVRLDIFILQYINIIGFLKHFQKYELLNSFLLSLHLRYHEIPRKEEIYSYITIIIRVLGNLIHKCTSIILRLFGISDSATLNRRHH